MDIENPHYPIKIISVTTDIVILDENGIHEIISVEQGTLDLSNM